MIITIRVTVLSAAILTWISSTPVSGYSLPEKRLGTVEDTSTVIDEAGCPKRPVFVIDSGGRTGNWILYYISTWLVGRHLFLVNKQVPYVRRHLRQSIMDIFENTANITLPVVEDIPSHCEHTRGVDWSRANTKKISMYSLFNTEQLEAMFAQFTGNIILPRGAFFMDVIFQNIQEIKSEFKYKKEWIDHAYQRLEEIKTTFLQRRGLTGDVKNVTLVSVHVRRTDYIDYMERNERRSGVGVEYFKAAIQYFRDNRSKFGMPVFVVVSDEKEWVEQKLITAGKEDDVFVAGSGDLDHATSDLALLSMCDHSIIDYGTYGLWGALYANGHKVMVKFGSDQIYKFLQGNPKWHFVDASENPIVVP